MGQAGFQSALEESRTFNVFIRILPDLPPTDCGAFDTDHLQQGETFFLRCIDAGNKLWSESGLNNRRTQARFLDQIDTKVRGFH